MVCASVEIAESAKGGSNDKPLFGKVSDMKSSLVIHLIAAFEVDLSIPPPTNI